METLSAQPSESSPAASGQACFHCGLPVPAGTRYRVAIDGVPRDMCCPGCEAVARAIVGAGLPDYYRHRSALPASPGEALPDFIEQLAVYDLPKVQASFVRDAGERVREASLILEGITCAACVWLNERHLLGLPGVLSVDINYTTHRARVRWDDSRIRLSDILRAVAAIGYTAHPFDPARQDEIHRRQRRTALWEIFVAGFGTMQVMMYALPVYLARDGEIPFDLEQLMRWASLILTLPVVLFSSACFFRAAWRDLKARRVGMDVPVALGVALAFSASCWATVSGTGAVYFDSIAMFVFFLLAGRFLEMSARQKASDACEKLVKLIPATARRLAGFPGSRCESLVAVADLVPGDHVLVRPGEVIPADGRVREGRTSVDEALLTGESLPLDKTEGDALTGGSVNVAGPMVMRVEKVGHDTVLAGIVRLLDRALAQKPPIATLADRVAGWFVAALLVVAAAVALYWYRVDPARALWVTVSMLVVTCPCALSLATPAALAAATGRLTRLGFLITRGHVLQTLASCTHFVFDKTGTLTLGRITVADTVALGGLSGAECLALAASLERGSEHPIGRAIAAAAARSGVEETRAVQVSNIPGSGVEGAVGGVRLRLGSPEFVAGLHHQALPLPVADLRARGRSLVTLGSAAGWLAVITLEDPLRPDAAQLVAALQAMGKTVVLLSGDARETAQRIGARLGIGTVMGGASPQRKVEYVARLQQDGAVVAMVGDGINDAPVLGRAQVSVAMGEATQVAQASADALLLSGRLATLLDAVNLARRTGRIVRQNFAWAILYNLLALPLAITGHVSPWMAGIGMAGSSLAVVLNALRLVSDRRPAPGARPDPGPPAVASPVLTGES